MPAAIDISGQRFGKLVAVTRVIHSSGERRWECKCDCGKTKVTRTSQLMDDSTKSCGCSKDGVEIICKVCSVKLKRKKSRPGKFCSHQCYWKDRVGRVNWNQGKGGYTTKAKGKKRKPMTDSARAKLKEWWQLRRGQKRKRSYPSGEDHPRWKGGLYGTERHRIMGSGEYARLIHNVFSRDNYTCFRCQSYGGQLHMDHIKSWADHPGLRLDPTNCRTVCRGCHFYITFNRVMPLDSKWGLGYNKAFDRKVS